MLIEHDGKRPRVHDSAYVAPTAVLCGDVRVGADCRILFGAVLTAETGTIEVGESCIVMENALLRGRESHPVTIGDHVLVGPHAHVNGARIGSQVFLATGVSVFPGAQIGSACEVRINAVVHVNSRVEPDTTVPIGWIAVGDPARLFEPGAHEQLWEVQEAIGPFPAPSSDSCAKRRAWTGSAPATQRGSAVTATTEWWTNSSASVQRSAGSVSLRI